ncbi:beige/BEACH domain protein [Pseudohyphozyma bogoriensis]|nr:beige/BEACH domain protein [Pseudohyphozyma bogoriensis]
MSYHGAGGPSSGRMSPNSPEGDLTKTEWHKILADLSRLAWREGIWLGDVYEKNPVYSRCRRLSKEFMEHQIALGPHRQQFLFSKEHGRYYLQTMVLRDGVLQKEWADPGLEAHEGDWLVTGSKGDSYTRPADQFPFYYQLATPYQSGFSEYDEHVYVGVNIVHAKQIVEHFQFKTKFSKGKYQQAEPGDWLCWSRVAWQHTGVDDVYVVKNGKFLANYHRVGPAFDGRI